MENGVKAIFIAGAIVITLALISLVVAIFLKNQVLINDGSTKVEFSTISYHNSQFTIYEKDDLTYANVQSLIGTIIENNARQTDDKFMVNVILEKYNPKTGGIYQPTGVFETVVSPLTNSFMKESKYIYLSDNSVYKGKVFKISLMYNDTGIIDRIKIEKMN